MVKVSKISKFSSGVEDDLGLDARAARPSMNLPVADSIGLATILSDRPALKTMSLAHQPLSPTCYGEFS